MKPLLSCFGEKIRDIRSRDGQCQRTQQERVAIAGWSRIAHLILLICTKGFLHRIKIIVEISRARNSLEKNHIKISSFIYVSSRNTNVLIDIPMMTAHEARDKTNVMQTI